MDPFARLIPLPRLITPLPGVFTLQGQVPVLIEANNPDDGFAAQQLARACAERGLAVAQPQCDLTQPAAGPVIVAGDPCRHLPVLQAMREEGLSLGTELGDEGYLLHVTPERVVIAGNSPAAVFYGFQTLIQLLPEEGGPATLPCVSIRDWPALRQRGITIDLARGEVSTPQELEAEIARCAHYKMNWVVLYLEDAFVFSTHPDIGENRDRLTREQVQQLDRFALQHHVTLVPCLDSPGHMEHLLRHPNYTHLAEGTETPALQMVISLAHPETYPLLRDLYGDLCDAFSSRFIHIGGDEAVALGWGATKPLVERFGAAGVFSRHLKELERLLASRGRRMICWADPFEPDFFKPFGLENYGLEGLSLVPRSTVIASWHYGPLEEFSFGLKAAQMGFDLQVQTAMGSHELFPMLESAAVNVESFLSFGHSRKVLGALHSNWGDVNSFREWTWPANAHFAEWAWRPDARPWAQLLPLAVESFFGPGTAELAAVYQWLGDGPRYVGWTVYGIGTPVHKAFFDPMEPWELDEGKRQLLEEFRARGAEARQAFQRARPRIRRQTHQIEFLEFALDQFDLMADLVEARGALATDRPRAKQLLERLSSAVPALLSRYEPLWHRSRMPRGLEPNRAFYAKLIQSIESAT